MLALRSLIRRPFESLSFARQFLLASALVVLASMLVIGSWLGRKIESTAVERAAAVAAVYVESILAQHIHDWPEGGEAAGAAGAVLDRIFVDGPLRRKVVRFKLWDASGRILYSSDHAQTGLRFPIDSLLASAFAGTVQARITPLNDADNPPEREQWERLLEVYVPVGKDARGQVRTVAEFYHSTENLGRDIRSAQQHSWILVSVASLAVYLLMFGWVRRASDTIADQRHDLHLQLAQLRASLDENERMRESLRKAGASTTALNEQFLRRIAADLHDGPAQTVALALMRFDELSAACSGCPRAEERPSGELHSMREALRVSLEELRNIAAGLGLPGVDALSLAETAWRAVRDFERRCGVGVESSIDDSLGEGPLAIKITLYRLLQESLANCARHAPGGVPRVVVGLRGATVSIEIRDRGPGFDAEAAARSGRLGLMFMQERVRLLGGCLEIDSAPGSGTRVSAQLPLNHTERIHA